jgi:hypothetical protein
VRVQVVVPDRIGDDEAALWRDLAAQRGDDVAPPDKTVLGRLRSALK